MMCQSRLLQDGVQNYCYLMSLAQLSLRTIIVYLTHVAVQSPLPLIDYWKNKRRKEKSIKAHPCESFGLSAAAAVTHKLCQPDKTYVTGHVTPNNLSARIHYNSRHGVSPSQSRTDPQTFPALSDRTYMPVPNHRDVSKIYVNYVIDFFC